MTQTEKDAGPKPIIDPFLLFAGGCSAMASRLIVHPLDTIRVRIQTHPPGTPVPLSLRMLVGHPILPRLYAGLPVALGFSIPALATYLTTYDATKLGISRMAFGQDADSQRIPWFKSAPIYLASGLTAEMVSGIIWTPMDVAKGRLQRGRDKHTTARGLLGDVWKKEGCRGLFRGYWVSIAVFGPQVSLYWALYEAFKTAAIPNYNPYASKTPNPKERGDGSAEVQLAARYAATSAAAMSMAAVVTNPIEIVRTRWQTSGGDVNRPTSILALVREMWAQAGWRAFMRGALIRGIYYMPSNAISMTTFEMLRRNRDLFGL